MPTQCECANPKPFIYGHWSPPCYLCESCGKNLTVKVESGEIEYNQEADDAPTNKG